jgi:hypothetical protein
MEQIAKQLIKRISDAVTTLTDKKISQLAHAPSENEWRAYIAQTQPHWEDIAWRVKEPNAKGETEVHLGFYSAKPSEGLSKTILDVEELSKGIVSNVIKNENGIRLVWVVNLNNQAEIDITADKILSIISPFIETTFISVCQNADNQKEINQTIENNKIGNNSDSINADQLDFLETKNWWNKEEVPTDWALSRAFICEAIKKDGRWIEIAPENLKNDFEIVSMAIAERGSALEFVSADMKKNKDIVLMAVSQDGSALEYAHESFKSDKDVVLKAVSQNLYALAHVNGEVLENLEMVNQLVRGIDEGKYKDFFFEIPASIRFEKSVLELISRTYPNANNWNNAECSPIFLNYLSHFDSQNPFRNVDNLSDFKDEYQVPLSTNHFESLKEEVEILIFEIDNSDHAWEELGGSERFIVIYDLHKNVLLPNKKQSPNEDELSLIKKHQYLDSMHVGIYSPYHNNQRFDGSFSVSNYFDDKTKNEKSFYISYHGEDVESHSCDNETLDKISSSITPAAMYHFISDVMRSF